MSKASGSKVKDYSSIRVSRKYARLFTMHYVKTALAISAVIAILFYILIAGTITRISWTNLGFVTVTSPAFRGGYAEPGSHLYINEDGHKDDFANNVLATFKKYDNISIVEVNAGPYGELYWQPSGLVTVNGTIVDATLTENPESNYLDNQYIVTCVEGDCDPGKVFIADHDDIFGVPSKGVLEQWF